MKKLIKVAVNDFRLVFRDNSLKIFIALPLLNLVVIRYVIPYLAGIYGILHDYINIILMLATTQGAIAFGFIYSMVLVDEKDTNVAKVYGVLPVSKFWFTAFRLIPLPARSVLFRASPVFTDFRDFAGLLDLPGTRFFNPGRRGKFLDLHADRVCRQHSVDYIFDQEVYQGSFQIGGILIARLPS
jgi:fluoroquinolone transport system permease protein